MWITALDGLHVHARLKLPTLKLIRAEMNLQINLEKELEAFSLKVTDAPGKILAELQAWIRWFNDYPEEAFKKLHGYVPKKKIGGYAEHEIQGIQFLQEQVKKHYEEKEQPT
jgi:inorganic pyrophosphatase